MDDTLIKYLFLAGSALLAGAINSLAGGGTLLTFPALFSALSGDGVLANGTSTLALAPGSLAGAWGYRKELAEKKALLRRLLLPSVVGGAVGALLVTRCPGSVFNMLVPWLILSAALLFLVQKPLARWLGTHKLESQPSRSAYALLLFFQLIVGIYGGYFGAGIGILMLTSLGFMAAGNIHQMNGVKTLLATAINGIAVVVFIIDGQVKWNYATAMAFSAIVGGYGGARLARRLPPSYIRGFVIFIGFSLAAYYFWRQSFQ